jgi:hypothetical protein
MIPATQKKLREAKFFLDLLKQEGRVPIWQAAEEPAEFYFNAFVSAARSVTYALQAEEKDRYDAWYPEWLSSRPEADRVALKRFNDERVKIVHRTGAELSSRNTLTAYHEVFPLTAPHSHSHSYFALTGKPPPASNAKVGTLQLICRFSDDTESTACDAAHEYVAVLDALVADFVRQHQGGAINVRT